MIENDMVRIRNHLEFSHVIPRKKHRSDINRKGSELPMNSVPRADAKITLERRKLQALFFAEQIKIFIFWMRNTGYSLLLKKECTHT